MRTLALLLFASILTPVYAQQKFIFPRDGNGLLDACSVLVNADDVRSSFTSMGDDRFTEKMGQINWCAGYLQATQDTLSATQVQLYIIAKMGVTFSGPDKVKQYALDSLRGACIPETAPIVQLARVLVKWLREHPERLHEPKSGLTADALKDAFPCTAPTPTKEAVKPAPVRP